MMKIGVLRYLVICALVPLTEQAAIAQALPEYGAILKNGQKGKGIQYPTVKLQNAANQAAARPVEPVGDIAFIRDGDVYTVTADGTRFKRLTTDGCNAFPIWSPNGRHIVFSKANLTPSQISASLWIVTYDGKYAKPIGKSQPFRAVYPAAWLPDGKGVIASVHSLDSDLSPELVLVTLDGKPYPAYQNWKNSGKKAGFLKEKGPGKPYEFTPGQAAAFSWDRKRMLFTASTEHFVDAPRLDLYELQTKDNGIKRLTTNPYIWIECLRSHPKASTLLSAEERYPPSGKHEAGLWILENNGKRVRKLASFPAASFSGMDWSYGGSYVVYQHTDTEYPRFESPSDFPTLSKHSSVWAVKADGTDRYKLADNACHPNWR